MVQGEKNTNPFFFNVMIYDEIPFFQLISAFWLTSPTPDLNGCAATSAAPLITKCNQSMPWKDEQKIPLSKLLWQGYYFLFKYCTPFTLWLIFLYQTKCATASDIAAPLTMTKSNRSHELKVSEKLSLFHFDRIFILKCETSTWTVISKPLSFHLHLCHTNTIAITGSG